MRIRIIKPVTTNAFDSGLQHTAEKAKDPGTVVEIVGVEKGPEFIEQPYDVAWTELRTLLEVEKAEKEGCAAAIIWCFGDPALVPAKEAVNIPVVGLGESTLHFASMLGRRFSIVGVGGDRSLGLNRDQVGSYGLIGKLASTRSVKKRVLDIHEDEKELESAIVEESRRAIDEDGADVIVLNCGGILGLASRIQEQLGVPVLDPTVTALKTAEVIVKLGLSQSKRAYARPLPKNRTM